MDRLVVRPLAVWLGCAVVAAAATAAASGPPRSVPECGTEVRLDGRLDEQAWSGALVIDLPVEVDPGENTAAPVRTEALVMHDRTNVYVGFRAYDPDPAAIRGHLADRDDAWSDDWVGVVLDTFNDQRRNYLFVVNPLGVQMDDIEVRGGESTPWDGIWRSAARRTEWGWAAEMAIPFSTLSFQRSDGPQIWRFDAIRSWPRGRRRQMGAFPRDRNDNCYLCQAIELEGFEGVTPGRDLEVVPTVTGAQTETRDPLPDGSFDGPGAEVEIGVTGTWGVTPNMTLAATINPDFSQVEADARQLDVNQPFALFFSEKRPFFMEGADFFETPLDVVYTRVVRDPAYGAKLTGKEGRQTFAGFVVEDDVTNLLLPASQTSSVVSLDSGSLDGAFRYETDLGARSSLGAVATVRDGDGYSNVVVGIDGDLRPTATDAVQFQLLGSRTRYPDGVVAGFDQPAGAFEGVGWRVDYSHEARDLSWWAQAEDLGRDLRVDLGFVPQVDTRGGEIGVDYSWIGTDDTWYAWLDLKGKIEHRQDHDGGLLFEEAAVMFTVSGPLQAHAYLRPSIGREGFAGREFDRDVLRLHLCLKPDRHSHGWFNVTTGDAVDYAGVRQAEQLLVDGGVLYRFGRHLQLTIGDTWERLDVADGRLYEANIAQLTAQWQFSPRAFLRAIVHRVAYDFEADRYDDDRDPRFREVFTQLLFSYKLNPRTVLFLGYSDTSLGNSGFDLVRAERSVFAKLGYAWLL